MMASSEDPTMAASHAALSLLRRMSAAMRASSAAGERRVEPADSLRMLHREGSAAGTREKRREPCGVPGDCASAHDEDRHAGMIEGSRGHTTKERSLEATPGSGADDEDIGAGP